MTNVIIGAHDAVDCSSDERYEYDYPLGLDLKPQSALHTKLLSNIMKRVSVSSSRMKLRHESWRQIDRTLNAYIHLDDAERHIKHMDSRKPVSTVFPHSYSILETIVASLDTLFLNNVIFNYVGQSPEDVVGAMLLEKVVDIHCKRFKVSLAMHTSFKDGLAYGIGASHLSWEEKIGFKTTNMQGADGLLHKYSEPTLLFEGNSLTNIDPYLLLLDPNYGAQSVQAGEFIGYVSRTNYYNLLGKDGLGGVFNIRHLDNKAGGWGSRYYAAKRDTRNQSSNNKDDSVLKPIDVVYVYINLIPKEWELGSSQTPEKWLFAVAGDRIIIQAQPLNLDHDMFPIAVCAPTFDGYSSTPMGRLEQMQGMQGLIDYLFNSHVANTRKAINDMIIYDPYMINTEDIANPQPGKLVRSRKAAWGKDIRGSIMQLQVNDITRANVSDAQVIAAMMNQISGSDDAMQGQLRQGGPERLSAAEFKITNQNALGRLESLARIVGTQYVHDIGYMFAMHTQQYMTQDVYINTVGASQEQLVSIYGDTIRNERMKVSPAHLNIDYDIAVQSHDTKGTTMLEPWINLFQIMHQNPELSQSYDMARIFRHIATLMGAKDVDSFLIQPVSMPDAEVIKQADAGNLVPIEELANELGR